HPIVAPAWPGRFLDRLLLRRQSELQEDDRVAHDQGMVRVTETTARDDVVLTLNAVDADLIERWRKRKKPFDGVTLVLPWPGVPLDQLRADIRLVIADLQPWAGDRIERLEVWHEHDGYVNPGMALGWATM